MKDLAIKQAQELADDLEERVTDEDHADYIEQIDEAMSAREDIAVLRYLAHMVREGETPEQAIAHLVSIWADIDGAGWN